MAYQWVLVNLRKNQSVFIKKAATLVGRLKNSPIYSKSLIISRKHAKIVLHPEGSLWVVDLGSTNGTYLNRRRIRPKCRYSLKHGDLLMFGLRSDVSKTNRLTMLYKHPCFKVAKIKVECVSKDKTSGDLVKLLGTLGNEQALQPTHYKLWKNDIMYSSDSIAAKQVLIAKKQPNNSEEEEPTFDVPRCSCSTPKEEPLSVDFLEYLVKEEI